MGGFAADYPVENKAFAAYLSEQSSGERKSSNDNGDP